MKDEAEMAWRSYMKFLKIMLVILLLCSVSVLSLSCASKSDSAPVSENQVVTVQRGNLIIDITAAGNLALSHTEDLAFDLFYQEGTVEEVLVEEGDTVEEGQVLVKLDTEEWEEQLSALEDKVTDAERGLTANKRDLIQKEINLKNAEAALEKAEDAWLDTVSAGRKVRRLEQRLEWYLENDPEEVEKIDEIEEDLERAWNDFFHVTSDSADAREVAAKEMGVELAQAQLEDAQISIDDAEQDLEDAQENLEEAKSKSPIITAPFAGFITTVNVEGGDEVLKGTVAVQLADPNEFEADILISEMDIFQVKLGGEAWVQVDAMPGLSLPAEVTHISPTANIQSGVVNYQVKVEIESLEAVMQEQQAARQEAMQNIEQGELPERLKQAIEEGQITQEQAEEMMKQMQQARGGQPELMPTMMPEDFQLREGLTVTVSILVEERNDVLLVPNAAITSSGGRAYVQVVSPDGTTTERAITTGISDWQYTEVTKGLSEGEQVVVPQGTATTPATEQQRGPMPFFGPPHR